MAYGTIFTVLNLIYQTMKLLYNCPVITNTHVMADI